MSLTSCNYDFNENIFFSTDAFLGSYEQQEEFIVKINFFKFIIKDKYNNKFNYSSGIFSPLGLYYLFWGFGGEELGDWVLYMIYFPGIGYKKSLFTLGGKHKFSLSVLNNIDWFFIREHKWWHFSPGLGFNYEYKDLQLQVGYNYNLDYALGDWHTNQGIFFSVGWGFGDDESKDEKKVVNHKRCGVK